jgi:hypothetical protein
MLARYPLLFALALVTGSALAPGCSCSAGTEDDDDGLGGSGPGVGPGTPASTGAFGTTGSGGGGSCTKCSSDLHSILDCDGNVIMECPPDQGCGATGCVPACQAAQENKSSIGCDYYSVAPDVITEGAGACFAAFIANTWGSPVTITVERDGQTFDVGQFARLPSGSGQSITYSPLPNGQLPPGEVAILFL